MPHWVQNMLSGYTVRRRRARLAFRDLPVQVVLEVQVDRKPTERPVWENSGQPLGRPEPDPHSDNFRMRCLLTGSHTAGECDCGRTRWCCSVELRQSRPNRPDPCAFIRKRDG